MTRTDAPGRPRNTVGLIGFLLAVVQTLTQILLAGVTTAIPVLAYGNGIDATSIGALFAGIALVQLLLAAATTGLGVAGVVRPGRPRILAAIALGVGAHGVLVGLATLVLPPLVGLVLQ
ncbi:MULTISPECIES: hypothetical protein [unclassified Rathayibacter]|uniref:hypothetical protein n=1 Tax=unclassified Rathayibacter TaxID=2609250 RepID=UPI00104B3AE5|nr:MULTISPECIES: hypothetical protein [unclassified Rathayibacter]TCL86030.1 hypothetical protein EDF49_101699 [Rathayibacter sp. PhB192]TCM31851.1 hypothetical protein EDF43_101699 [Rathayibacter sp. PhB179]